MPLVAPLLALVPALAAPDDEVVVARPDLWVVSVGINAYARPSTLRGAVNDARAVDARLRELGTGFFGEVHSTLLLDHDATREGIESALSRVASRARPEDTFVFFFTGHSMAFRRAESGAEPEPEFVLVPCGALEEPAGDRAKMLPAEVLALRVTAIPARQQLVVVDGCAHERAAEELTRSLVPQGTETARGRRLAVIVPGGLATESADEATGEYYGALSLAVVRAMSDASDRDGDAVLGAHELLAAIPRAIRTELQVRSGMGASPVRVALRGGDFPLGRCAWQEGSSATGVHFAPLVESLARSFGVDHVRTALAELFAHQALLAGAPPTGRAVWGRPAGRAGPLAERVAVLERAWGSDDPRLAGPLALLGAARAHELDVAAARAAFERSLALLEAADPPRPLLAAVVAADHSLACEDPERAAASYARALEHADALARDDARGPAWIAAAAHVASEVRGWGPPAERDAPARPIVPRLPRAVPLLPDRAPAFDVDAAVVGGDTVIVRGAALDEQGIVDVTVDGVPVEVTPTGRFWYEAPLGRGVNTLTLRAVDAGGTVVERALRVERRLVDEGATRGFGDDEGGEPSEPPLPPRRDMALLFATDTYDDDALSDLANPIADARAIAAELEGRFGFEVELVEDPTRRTIIETLERYQRMGFGDEEDSQLLVFFAGHGRYVPDLDQGYVQPRDAEKGYRGSYYRMRELADVLDLMPHRRVLLVLDVCYGGAVFRTGRGEDDAPYRDADAPEILRRVAQGGPARLALTSGSLERVADGEPGRHSPFAARLLEALRSGGGADGDGLLLFDELLPYARRVVGQEALAGWFGRSAPGATFVLVEER